MLRDTTHFVSVTLVKGLLTLDCVIDYTESRCVIYQSLIAHAVLDLILYRFLRGVIRNRLVISRSKNSREYHVHMGVDWGCIDGTRTALEEKLGSRNVLIGKFRQIRLNLLWVH
jgi:hypothetical protein